MDNLPNRIDNFLTKVFSDFKPVNRGSKVIHDPLWGSNLFYPWEIAIIDSPLFQRLRRIHQTGTAYFTYPSSSHSRFCHSLGVTILADKLLHTLKEKVKVKGNNKLISDKDIYEVRLAGLVHDFGHCFFSHTSEQVLENLAFFNKLKQKYPEFGKKKIAPHEIFAYFILTNNLFKKFWEKNIESMFRRTKDIPELENIARIIIKSSDIPPQKRFLREIITGPYDVDKLEYLYRDGYNAGLNIAYDIERYFYKINVEDVSRYTKIPGEHRLVMDFTGITVVEQLIFSKMMLYSYIYHHQKVRAADCLIRDIVVEIISRNDLEIRIKSPFDLLNYTDYDILSCFISGGKSKFNGLVKKLQNRYLLKRCFVINRDYVEGLKTDEEVAGKYESLCEDMRDVLKSQLKMRQEILERINKRSRKKYDLTDVYIDLPPVPPIEEAAKAPIKLPNGKIEPMSDYFQLEGWQKTYELKKLRGYFFVNPTIIDLANKEIRDYLREKYNLSFSSLSSQLAKVIDGD